MPYALEVGPPELVPFSEYDEQLGAVAHVEFVVDMGTTDNLRIVDANLFASGLQTVDG